MSNNENGLTLTMYFFIMLIFIAIIVGIRMFIVGGFNDCFWASDIGTCLAIRGK